ncbi:hypothetical protein B4589_010570 [Halolamina sp. CBA1230]|nr:hypothetical protein [Halolamina sp. CBA1230]QKY20800.1 hypothetical protein B4589_010570 [Halolamina sp. CBA1230]
MTEDGRNEEGRSLLDIAGIPDDEEADALRAAIEERRRQRQLLRERE